MGDSPYLHFKRSESSEDVVSGIHQRPPPYSPHGSDIQDDLSGEQSPTNGSSLNLADPGLPKKKTRSRTISSLTAEQLARKRAHDRDAQRAIRTRTKNQITSLESKLKELENEKGEWEFKTSELRKELENALDALDSIKRNGIQPPPVPGSTTSSGIVARPGLALSSKSPVSVRAESVGHPGYVESEHGSDNIALSSNGKDTPAGAMSLDFVCHGGFKPNGYRQIQDQPYEYTARKRSLADLTSSASSDGMYLSGYPVVRNFQAEIRRRISGAQSLLTSSPVSTVYSIPSVQYPGTYCVRANGHWEVMPRHLPPTCILDRVYLEFLEEQARLHRVNGTPLSVLAGPPQPDITFIVSPGSRPPRNGLTQVMAAIVDTFGDLVELPERVAIVYVLYIWMRWAINPTQESYDNMPEYIKPRPSQLFTARPIWFDHMPWPMSRDAMAKHPEKYNNTEFSIPYTGTLSVNWPYDPMSTVMEQSTNEYVINPMFETHIRKIENWSVGTKFAELYPDLAPHVKIVDHSPAKKFDMRIFDVGVNVVG
ncbi:hypothetical protein TWF106_009565 [Orbilia oligospora]|uniref:BZIP domain-containing protein n=1 Tax=Orbilia oligospora TaxID=2813651 RepID=A0A6G1MBX5_ORBOL|nr:hypothetical protein TWF788_005563 [Orbilia oligospora]KAF3209793.1 hypothetical protein TWF191_011358 [Orbilia oligospora]KAF3213276.1 hypothetical protein TWF106_009565 [Orbilia oligospora]KAF3252101.1 hypothetical protein TWF192_004554 [Orbilia oligospora]